MDLHAATRMADVVLEMRGLNRWFLPGTRERLIEVAWRNTNKEAIIDQFLEILGASEIDDPGSDPCDEVNTWAMWQRQMHESGLHYRRGVALSP